MLIVLSRVKDKLTIGDSISVEILGIQGKRVRLGIKAPKEIVVRNSTSDKKKPK